MCKKKDYIASMKEDDGQIECDRHVADIFADFYEELYRSATDAKDDCFINYGGFHKVDPVRATEADEKLKNKSWRKACDSNGIAAELLKDGGQYLRELLAEVFTDIMRPCAIVPQAWKETRLKVLKVPLDSKYC